jgi:hypothetical protein
MDWDFASPAFPRLIMGSADLRVDVWTLFHYPTAGAESAGACLRPRLHPREEVSWTVVDGPRIEIEE